MYLYYSLNTRMQSLKLRVDDFEVLLNNAPQEAEQIN